VKSYRIFSPFLLWALLLSNVPALAAAAPAKPVPAGEFPLHITAARLEADQKEGFVVFIGEVKATYGDSTLYADRLWVYFKPKPPAPKGAAPPPAKEPSEPSPLGDLGGDKIDRIVAKGQVRLVQEDRVATGEEAVYYKDRDEVVLSGNPQLWRAENTLKGERIIFNLTTNRVLVESSPQKRVEALLYTQGTAGGKESLPLGPKPQKSRRP
jgi:lipopolysaccharide export system protein LptA